MSMTTDEDVRARVDALVAEMTPEEKAGQLTQYFYMGFMRDQAADARRASPSWSRPRWPAAASARCCS